uniref:RING-type domain-containing protein n=1 Tax=Globodera rostochiensis TaxID=31243 RepID=A0A914HXM5_GLORO
MGVINTKFKKSSQIEDAEQIIIDSSPLHCPICLNIFRKAPEVLPCGHSHCQDCLRRVEGYAVRDAVDRRIRSNQTSIECPLCRARCPVNRRKAKNYAIEAIIESLSTISNEQDVTNETIAAKNLAIKRLVQNELELGNQVRELEAKVDRTTRTAFFVFGVAVAYFGKKRLMPEQIIINSSPLHCPVCFGVFSSAPEVLPCGHSHCQDCLREVESHAVREAAGRPTDTSIECPLCRARCPVNRRKVKNYAIEAIIESLSTISNEQDVTNETIAAKNLAIKRLEKKESELKSELKKRLKEQEAEVERWFFFDLCELLYYVLPNLSQFNAAIRK